MKRKRLRPELDMHKEPKYLKWLHEVFQPECFVCKTSIGIQLHHVKRYSSDSKKDNLIIGLCYNHHLGNEFSVHGTPVEFRDTYSIEEQQEAANELYNAYKLTNEVN